MGSEQGRVGDEVTGKKWQKSSQNTGKKWHIFCQNFEELHVFDIKKFEELHFLGGFHSNFNEFAKFVGKSN